MKVETCLQVDPVQAAMTKIHALGCLPLLIPQVDSGFSIAAPGTQRVLFYVPQLQAALEKIALN